ncbi:hypothetical protein D9615_007214 [Tricholomella constricta]|uniref:DUF5648 domain-containing protein n=1 Tax=Tricholomella constricta TaxID=117010 RepID=A0A8H5M125_9AGAR|nr:hypothetical protein D9615_007214 [Tricholomella constricta]
MKFGLFVVSVIAAAATFVGALPEAEDVKRDIEARAPQACGNPRRAVPWFRAYNPRVVDHFYTANRGEWRNSFRLGYNNEGTAAYVFSNSQPGTVPFFRLYSSGGTDHFYTTNAQERDNAASNLGYKNEGITGWIYPNDNCGGVPLYRLYNPTGIDHFYTTSASERDSAARNGYNKEGIAGYVFPF